ncbi:hypothetical protein HDV62DRAFT_295525 [Trichoderma sp. SZMC 28011]
MDPSSLSLSPASWHSHRPARMISKVLCISTPYPVHVGTHSQMHHPLPPRKPVLVLEEPNLAAQRRQSYSATLAISSVTMPSLTLHSSAALSGHVRHPSSRLGRGIRKGYHPVVCWSRIELGEHMPTREYGKCKVLYLVGVIIEVRYGCMECMEYGVYGAHGSTCTSTCFPNPD